MSETYPHDWHFVGNIAACKYCARAEHMISPRSDDECPTRLREALDAVTAERDRLRDALRDQRTTIATTIRARATQRRATAEKMTAEGEHADAARYYTYAAAEECCAVLVERGTDEPEAADLAAKEAK